MGPQQSKGASATPPATKPTNPQSSPISTTTATKPAASPQPPPVVAVRKRQPDRRAASGTDLAILELKLQRERLQKATDKYGLLAERMKAEAVRAMQSGGDASKAVAIALIRRSRAYEGQIESCSKTLFNVETSLNAIEDGALQQQVLRALEGGAAALDQINASLSRAGEVMDRLRDAVEQSREIDDILSSTTMGPASLAEADVDEEALERWARTSFANGSRSTPRTWTRRRLSGSWS